MAHHCRQSKESPSSESVQAAALMVTRYRESLDCTLGLPEWQDGIADLVVELELPRVARVHRSADERQMSVTITADESVDEQLGRDEKS